MSSKNLCKIALLVLCLSMVSAYGENLVTNPDFEDGKIGWSGRGCSIEAVKEGAHGGEGCVKVYDRQENWQGIKQDMLDKMTSGKTYTVSGWAKLAAPGSETIIISFEKADDAGTKYHNAAKAAVTDAGWAEIKGEFTLEASGSMSVLDLYFEGPEAGVAFYVDDVSVTVKEAAETKEKATINLKRITRESLSETDSEPNEIPSEDPNEPQKESSFNKLCCHKNSDPNDPNGSGKECKPKQ